MLLAWENEAYLALDEFGADNFDIVFPPTSILAEPPVAVVDENVDAKGTRKVAEAYLNYLYSAEGQTIAAKHHYRPSKPDLVPADELQKLPEHQADLDRRSALRRLGEGAALAFRRRRHLRPDLQAGPVRFGPSHVIGTRAAGWRFRQPSVIPGFGLTFGFTLAYLTLIILIPLSGAGLALGRRSAGPISGRSPRTARTLNALKISFGSSFIAARSMSSSARIVAWVLVRYNFPGRRIIDAIVDLPFALPTAVAGIALSTLYAPKGWLGSSAGAARHQDRLYAARHRHRADLHRPALRGPHRAAGPRGVRQGGRGSRRHARRQPLADHHAASSCRA